MSNHNIRVVVTGMGIVCSSGSNISEFFQSLKLARPGISPLVGMPVCRGKTLAAQIKSPPLDSPMRLYRLARKAMKEALQDAGPRPYFFGKTGLFCATVGGDSYYLERDYKNFGKPHRRKKDQALARIFPPGDLAHRLARYFSIRDFRESNSNACASGNIALARARHKILSGKLSRAIVCGAEQLKPTAYWGSDRAGILGTFCGPFSRRRDGTILGDGAAVIILESLDSARARGARIHAEILGYGTSCSFEPHEIIPDLSGDGVARALEKALEEATVPARNIDYINAHATGTVNIEISECAGIRKAFGLYAAQIPVNSTKSITGHISAASAVIETIATIHSLKHDFIHGNAGLSDPDESLGVKLVGDRGRHTIVNRAINISLGAGGVNTAVVLGKYSNRRLPFFPGTALKRQRIGITSLSSIIASEYEASHGVRGRVDLDHLAEIMPAIGPVKHLNRTAVLGFAAGLKLLDSYKTENILTSNENVGLICGTGLGGNGQWSAELCAAFEINPRHITPSQALSHGAHLTNTLLAREFGLTGITYTLINGWFSAFSTLDCAMDMIALDGLETVIISATDALDSLTEKAMTLLPEKAAKFRSESAAGLIVESEQRLRETGRRPMAWVMAVDFDYGDSFGLQNRLLSPCYTGRGLFRVPDLAEYGAATPYLALESLLTSLQGWAKSKDMPQRQPICLGGAVQGLGAAQISLEIPLDHEEVKE